MRILHVIQRYYPYIGGSELYMQEIGEQLVAEGHHVTVLTTDAWDLDHFWAGGRRRIAIPKETHLGVAINRFDVVRAPGPPVVYPIIRRLMVELGKLPGTTVAVRRLAALTPRVPALVRWLETTTDAFDLVVTCNITLDFTIIPVQRWAARRRIPHLCIPFVHLGEPGNQQIVRYYTQPFQLDLLRRATGVVVQTPREGAYLAHKGIPAASIHTIGCWVRPETLLGGDGARFREQHGITGPVVLSVGTAARDKGTLHLVVAMQRLWAAGSDAHLVLIAATTLAQFEQFWETLDADTVQRITLIKAAPHQTKLDALAAAQLFALPSRTDSFGIVFLEAWCYDLPVIGADAGGVPDVIADGVTGRLVPFGDTAALADVIGGLLSDTALARRLGTTGHNNVLQQWTFERKFAEIKTLYERTIQGHAPISNLGEY